MGERKVAFFGNQNGDVIHGMMSLGERMLGMYNLTRLAGGAAA